MAVVEQIKNLVNDSVKDALGGAALSELNTSDVVSMGKALANFDAYESFYKSLANRIVKTVIFARSYNPDTRGVLRDEQEYGAFVQGVYYEMPDAVDNPEWAIPDSDGTYKQVSPYDVENVIKAHSLIFGGQGTWALEYIRPNVQIKTAFTSWEAMAGFIDGIYVQAENSFKLETERLVAAAVNTSMAECLNHTGHARNLLTEYNTATGGNLTAAKCMMDKEFLRFASKEISLAVKHMGDMSKLFNIAKNATFTDRSNMVVEVLADFAKATDDYLSADTFHKELVSLPRYTDVSYWQGSGTSYAFADTSSIHIKHDDLVRTEADDDGPKNETGVVNQSGIICFIHDIENVAAYFGDRRQWTHYNDRQDIYIHGDTARKGYAIKGYTNALVFYVADAA